MKKTFRFFKWTGQKAILLFVLTATLLMATVGATVAYVVMRTRTIQNHFPPGHVHISSWSGNDIINAGTVDMYMRAIVIATWVSVSDENRVLSASPKLGEDYNLEIESGWFLAEDGFYYHTEKIVAARSVTLIKSAAQIGEQEGFYLRIQVISSGMQANPKEAVEESWTAVQVAEDGRLISANQG